MKTKLFLLGLICQSLVAVAQYITIDELTTTSVDNGINVHLIVTTYNGAGYLSHDYTFDNQTIFINVCYWFNLTLPVYQITNDFFIPVDNTQNYSIQVRTFHSANGSVCDYYSSGPTASTEYLNTISIANSNKDLVYPNPASDFLYISSEKPIDELLIFDYQGKLAVKSLIKDNIDIKQLETGWYWIALKSNAQIYFQKLIVSKL